MTQAAADNCERWALELVQRAREARDSAEFRAWTLDTLRAVVPCDRAIFSEPGSERPLVTYAVDDASIGLIQACEQNFEHYAREVETATTAAYRAGGILDHDVFSASERSRSAFYSEIVQPQRIESMLVLMPKWRGSALGWLRLERVRGRGFRQEELALALRLLPAAEVSLAALRAEWLGQGVRLQRLTPRETEIAMHVARGLSTPQIGLLLGTSKLTVRNQLGRIFEKLGVGSRAELASYVARRRTPA